MFKASRVLFPIPGFIKHVFLAWRSHTTIKVKYLLLVLTRATHSGAPILVSESSEVQQHKQQACPPTLLMWKSTCLDKTNKILKRHWNRETHKVAIFIPVKCLLREKFSPQSKQLLFPLQNYKTRGSQNGQGQEFSPKASKIMYFSLECLLDV